MNQDTRAEIAVLLAQIGTLRDECNAILDRPFLVRLVLLSRVQAKLERAQDLLARVEVLAGLAPRPRPAPERWLGMGRSGWQCMQFAVGLWNAFWFWHVLGSRPLMAALSLLGVAATALWRMPRR